MACDQDQGSYLSTLEGQPISHDSHNTIGSYARTHYLLHVPYATHSRLVSFVTFVAQSSHYTYSTLQFTMPILILI